ncbi:MAG: sulfur oxidation c-type cytochrome SoxX [Pseudomonadota bacterium]
MTQRSSKALVALAGAAALVAAAAQAETLVKPTEVAFDDYGAVETPLTDEAGDPDRGKTVMVTKSVGNCISCHAAEALSDAPWHGEVGPALDGAGDRWTEAELRGIVVNAKKMFPGSVMPSFYRTTDFIRVGDAFTGKAHPDPENVDPLLSAQQVEDVVAFLKTLKEE